MTSDSVPAPDVGLPAHGQLEGRTSTRRNRRCPVQRRTSPGFLTPWRPPVGFPMPVLRCDPGDEFRQRILPPNWAQNNAALSVQGQCHGISFPKACLFGNRERNAHGQTVPPFRNCGFTRHGIYFEYTSIAPQDGRPIHLAVIRQPADLPRRTRLVSLFCGTQSFNASAPNCGGKQEATRPSLR